MSVETQTQKLVQLLTRICLEGVLNLKVENSAGFWFINTLLCSDGSCSCVELGSFSCKGRMSGNRKSEVSGLYPYRFANPYLKPFH
ncbi:hypothetical protein CEXT_241361 [Caerostris extrusa]|uniref:SWIM-type domain-containing protein n=1 Tax=Caerostris extrusa TaxID=172846 RepID=A0AAV4WVM0_CAEEX|nr:hypothetical protein CEXT_241361 [Caerostris extrusa]